MLSAQGERTIAAQELPLPLAIHRPTRRRSPCQINVPSRLSGRGEECPPRWPRASSWQRASELSTRPRRTARGWLRTQRHCPTGGAWRPGSPRPRETRVYGMCRQFDGAMRCFGPNVASESNALPSDDRERNPGGCAAVDLNARPEGIEALSSHRVGVKRRPDFTIGICSLPQRLPVKLLQRLQPHLFVFEDRFRQLHVCSPECSTRAPTLPRDQ